MKTLIFSDLDGTFLNHDDYSFKGALEALEILKDKNIPLIFTTSKTKTEVELLQKEVGISEPFIIENGAAIFFPKIYKNLDLSFLEEYENYYIFSLGIKYNEILNFYNQYKVKFKMIGFSDMSLEDISFYTDLSKDEANFSKNRTFSEPFILKDDFYLEELKEKAKKSGLKITKGGRFYHLMGEKQDKGIAVKRAIEIFSSVYNDEIKSIGLGDGENDLPMLLNVDIPIIIKNHNNKYIDFDCKNIQKSTFKGSKGWNEMVKKNV